MKTPFSPVQAAVAQASSPAPCEATSRLAGGTPALRSVAALLLTVLLATLPLRAADDDRPPLGSQGSGVVDDAGKRVGPGPNLLLVGPAPEQPEEDARAPWVKALEWLQTYLGSLNQLEQDLFNLKAALRTGQLRIKELRAEIADYTRSRDKAVSDTFRDFMNERLFESSTELAALEEEQRKLLAGVDARWNQALGNLDAKIAEAADFPQFQQALQALRGTVVQKQSLSSLEVLLSSGQSDAFRTQAVQVANQYPALQSPVLMLRVADYLERGQGREALYAARLGLQQFPGNPAFQLYASAMETSYLRMIAAKATGDGADVQRAWNDYSGSVSDSYIRQTFFGGLTRPLQYLVGQTDALETLHGNATDRAVMEHNGIQMMLRLRAKGLSFDEIRGLSTAELQQRAPDLFGSNVDLSHESALALSLSIRAAFANSDVQRVLSQNKQQFDVDLGRSYYSGDEYDDGIIEYAVDAINVKNAILFLGPSAVVSYGARQPGMLAQLAQKMGAPQQLAQTFSSGTGAATVRDWLFARPSMQAVATAIGRTRGGQSMAKGLEALRYLRYDAPGVVRFGTGLAEAAAQMVMFEVGGKAGHALGGDFGEFIGQALVMLAGNPIADAQAASEKQLAATAEQMARTRANWLRQNEALKQVRLPIHQGVDAANAGRTLTAVERQAIESAVQTADNVAVGAVDDMLSGAAADEAGALASAGRNLLNGQDDLARMADDLATGIEQRTAKASQSIEASEAAARRAAATAPPEPPIGNTRALTGQPPLENPTWPTKASSTQVIPPEGVPPRPAPPTTPPPEPPPTMAAPAALGDEAMAAGQFGEAVAHYRTAFREATQPAVRDQAYRRLMEAREAAKYTQALEARAQRVDLREVARKTDQAMEEFSAGQRQQLQRVSYEDTVPMNGTAGGPRKVVDAGGNAIGIWKPKSPPSGRNLGQMNEDGQLMAEVLYSRFARALGLRVPHAERHVLTQVVNGQVVQHEGVLIRWIDGAQELAQLTPGARTALKKQIAKLRALNVFMGNYDVHMGNYMVDRAGNVWGIDAGMSMLATPRIPADRAAMIVPGIDTAGSEAVVWSRTWRDWYHHHNNPTVRSDVSRLDDALTYEDMADVAQDIKRLGNGRIYDEVEAVMGRNHSFFDDVNSTLNERRVRIDELLQERWQPAPQPRGALLPFPAPEALALRPAA